MDVPNCSGHNGHGHYTAYLAYTWKELHWTGCQVRKVRCSAESWLFALASAHMLTTVNRHIATDNSEDIVVCFWVLALTFIQYVTY